MKLELTGALAKLARSREHAQALHREGQSWFDRNPYGLTQQVNADSTRYSIVLHELEPAPLQRWTLMFADAVHNLRCALDYLIYAVAISDTKADPPAHESRLQFPITDCRSTFDQAVKAHRLGDISDPVRTFIEGLQPYNRPHPTLPPILRIIRELNNADKHRLTRLAYGASVAGEVALQGMISPGSQFHVIVDEGEIKDGAEVISIMCDRPSPDMQWDFKYIQMIIAIWHDKRDPAAANSTGHSESVALLQILAEEVETIILKIIKLLA